MPQGFYTIEQWKPRRRGGKPQWVAVAHADARASVSAALRMIEQRDRSGFFRVIQTQRQVWAERVDEKLRLRKWHAARRSRWRARRRRSCGTAAAGRRR